MTLLTNRNAELQRRLNALKNDLNANGHNVETWLANCPDVEHSISTETASEAEMYRTIDENDEHEMNNSNSPTLKTSPCKSN